VIDRQALTPAVAVLTGVAVTSKDVLLVEGDTVEKRLADVDREPDDRRQRERGRRRPDHTGRAFDGLGLPGEQERDGAARVGEMQRLEAIVQHQHRNLIHLAYQG
jgi:hypothetical protein